LVEWIGWLGSWITHGLVAMGCGDETSLAGDKLR